MTSINQELQTTETKNLYLSKYCLKQILAQKE